MRAYIALAFVGMMLLGCGEEKKSLPSPRYGDFHQDRGASKDKAKAREPAGREEFAVAKDVKPLAQVDAKPRPRLVVYTGRVELLVEDFDASQAMLAEVIATHKAFVTHSVMTGEPGEPRSGTWTIRVPVAGFDALMDGVAGLGEARKKSKDSDDVTDRYYDTEAAALNLEAREKALRKLYEEKIAGSKLAELLEVDRELTQVRGDINVKRGQMKRWDNLAAFSTLELSMRDRKGYVPPESPVYTTQIGRAWGNSVDALVGTGKALFLFFVVITPWVGVMLVLGLVIGVPLRRMLRRRAPDEGVSDPPPLPPA